jgi:hypothetical protein
VGGWLVGLPLTSGPIVFFLALDHGAAFARAAAVGALAGAIAEAAFALAYGRLAARCHWRLALPSACLAFGAATAALQRVTLTLVWLFPAVTVALALVLRLMPRGSPARGATPLPRWDIPARMTVTTGLVLSLTWLAPALGPRLSGLLATFPVYAAILAVFAHQLQGPAPAVEVLRGLLLGLFSFAGFFLVLGGLIERVGVAPAFAAAAAVALLLQGASLALLVGRT